MSLPVSELTPSLAAMLLFLCSATDLSALWAYDRLRARGVPGLELVSSELIACALRWEHRLWGDAACTTITLTDGRTIRSGEVSGVLNRISWIGDDQLARALPADRTYATQELVAFYLSWLNAFRGPIINPPTPQGLCGRFRDSAEWTMLAWRAGLPLQPHRCVAHGSGLNGGDGTPPDEPAGTDPPRTRTVTVIGSRVVGVGIPDEVAEACLRLACDAQTPLLGVDFGVAPDGSWTFTGASPVPDLTLGGAELIDALLAALHPEERA